jgi:hypothetical protein
MTLPYPPPWMDKRTLCEHICISDRTVDAWVSMGLLPPGRLRGGKLLWKWSEVERYLENGGDIVPDETGATLTEVERIRANTRKALNRS